MAIPGPAAFAAPQTRTPLDTLFFYSNTPPPHLTATANTVSLISQQLPFDPIELIKISQLSNTHPIYSFSGERKGKEILM